MTADLRLLQDGVSRNLMSYLEREGEMLYPGVGERTYRVPPVKFQAEKTKKNKTGAHVLDLPTETDLQNNLAEDLVCGAFEKLSDKLLEEGQGPIFIITNFEYDNYLNKLDLSHLLPKEDDNDVDNHHDDDDGADDSCNTTDTTTREREDRVGLEEESKTNPVDTEEKRVASHTSSVKLPRDVAPRGELDGLLLHRKAGVLLIQTKSVGHNFGSTTCPPKMDPKENITTSITKAAKQLSRDRLVMTYVMGEIGLVDAHMTSLVALPNVTREDLHASFDDAARKNLMGDFSLDLNLNFLCKEDFSLSGDKQHRNLRLWWDEVLMKNSSMESELDMGLMKQIAFRTVGLLSTVSVWSMIQPRVEVRNLHDATLATANSFTQVIISPHQAEVLKREDRFLYIWGTAGSGKTLLLSLKGRYWLRKKRTVVILNTRLGSKGRVIGRAMERSINKSPGIPKKAECIDFDLEMDISVLKEDLSKCIKSQEESVCILFDEVTWMDQTIQLMDMLRKTYPDICVWCAGMLEEFCLPGFEKQHLKDVLRCPPSVQRVLRVIDNNKKRAVHYLTDSIKAGLATDGPKPFFVIHSEHGDPNVEPLDCEKCAGLVAGYLKDTLNIKHPRVYQEEEAAKKKSAVKNSQRKERSQSFGSEHLTRKLETYTHAPTSSPAASSSPPTPSSPGTSSSSSSSQLSTTPSKSNVLDSQNIPGKNPSKSEKGRKEKHRNKGKKKEVEMTASPSPSQQPPPASSSSLSSTSNNKHLDTTPEKSANTSAAANTATQSVKNSAPISKDSKKVTKMKNTEKSSCDEDDNLSKAKKLKMKRQKVTKDEDKNVPELSSEKGGKNEKIEQTEKGGQTGESKITEKGGKKEKTEKTAKTGDSGGGSKTRARTKSDCTHGSGGSGGVEFEAVPPKEGLRYRNVVIPVTMPREWHHLNDKNYYSISREALAQNMLFMGSSPFCNYLLKNDVPLKVELAMRLTIEGKEEEDEHLIMCPAGAVHGLEYKVVICLPSACSTPEVNYFNEGVLQGELGYMRRMELTAFGEKLLEGQRDRARRNLGSISTDDAIFNTNVSTPCGKGSSTRGNEGIDLSGGRCNAGVSDNNRDTDGGSCLGGSERDVCSLGSSTKSLEEVECNLSIDGIRIATHVEGDPENDVIYRDPSVADGGGISMATGIGGGGSDGGSDDAGRGGGVVDNAGQPKYDRDLYPQRGSCSISSESRGPNWEISGGAAGSLGEEKICSSRNGDDDDVDDLNDDNKRSAAGRSLPSLSQSSSSTTSSLPASLPSLPTQTMRKAPTISEVAKSPHLQTCGFCGTDHCVCGHFSGPEMAALNRLRPWEKAYLLMTVSRCTASVILVLP